MNVYQYQSAAIKQRSGNPFECQMGGVTVFASNFPSRWKLVLRSGKKKLREIIAWNRTPQKIRSLAITRLQNLERKRRRA